LQRQHTGPLKEQTCWSLHVTFHQLPFARFSGYNDPEVKFVTAVSRQSTANSKSIQLHSQDVIPLQPIVFLHGIHQLMGMSM
jgi:hypothetical protein